jgi:hypothetical protein
MLGSFHHLLPHRKIERKKEKKKPYLKSQLKFKKKHFPSDPIQLKCQEIFSGAKKISLKFWENLVFVHDGWVEEQLWKMEQFKSRIIVKNKKTKINQFWLIKFNVIK